MGATCKPMLCCCWDEKDPLNEPILPTGPEGGQGYYQAEGIAGEIKTKSRDRFQSEGESDDGHEPDSYDEETDAEIEPTIVEQARNFFRAYDSDEQNTELYVEQFSKLLKRRRYRRMIIYLGNRNVDDYKNNIRSRIEDLCSHVDPKPEEHMKDKVLEAMVKLSLEAKIRSLIVDCINSKMSCE